ncbi:unnamed protein product [Allacma fusca]|uniref:Pro-neuropeptide Y n=1 Tax=Allacma fusca TaxID=39272 RepID=A0A8J2JMM9_9HEXA|nr:unnamed protein product [Allacma fusca]
MIPFALAQFMKSSEILSSYFSSITLNPSIVSAGHNIHPHHKKQSINQFVQKHSSVTSKFLLNITLYTNSSYLADLHLSSSSHTQLTTEMGSFGFWLIVVLGVIYLQSESSVRGEALTSMEAEARPQRPRVFTSPDELRNYLEALSKYYALAGRPRFGKRVITKTATPANSVSNLSILDMYDALHDDK